MLGKSVGYLKAKKVIFDLRWQDTFWRSAVMLDIWRIFKWYLRAKFDLPWPATFQGESEGGGDWGDRGLLGSGRFTKSSLLDTPVPNPTSRLVWYFDLFAGRFPNSTLQVRSDNLSQHSEPLQVLLEHSKHNSQPESLQVREQSLDAVEPLPNSKLL